MNNKDVLRHIASYLPRAYLLDFFLVCRNCNFTTDLLFWKRRIELDYPYQSVNPILPYHILYRKLSFFNYGKATVLQKSAMPRISEIKQLRIGDVMISSNNGVRFIYNGIKLEKAWLFAITIGVIEQFPVDYWDGIFPRGDFYQFHFDMTPYIQQIETNKVINEEEITSWFIDWRNQKYTVKYEIDDIITGSRIWEYNDNTLTLVNLPALEPA